MAEDKEEESGGESKSTESKSTGPTYSAERLIAEADTLVGYPAPVVAGALQDLGKDEGLSVKDVKTACEERLSREVKSDEEA